MKLKKTSKNFLALYLSVGIFQLQTISSANAGMIATREVVSTINHDRNREKIAKYLEREDVKTQLVKFGVNPNEASMRIASLSDTEVQKLAGQIDKSVAGGDVIVISLMTVLIVVLIIFLIRRI